jgi:hypothetical protein
LAVSFASNKFEENMFRLLQTNLKKICFVCFNKFEENMFGSTSLTERGNETWERCYDHNFMRFLPIFSDKIGVFLKNQCHDNFFSAKLPFVGVKNANFFDKFFCKFFFTIKTSVPAHFSLIVSNLHTLKKRSPWRRGVVAIVSAIRTIDCR